MIGRVHVLKIAGILSIFSSCLVPARTAFGLGEEHFGNEPLSAANYDSWPGVIAVVNDSARVYHNWVNGNEHFYYRGGLADLNKTLEAFAKAGAKEKHVVIRPGPGRAQTFAGKTLECNWRLHLLGGIAAAMAKRGGDQGVWDLHPTLTIYVDDPMQAEAIRIPDGVTVLTLQDLRSRFHRGLKSANEQVRGYAAYFLGQEDNLHAANVPLAATLLDAESEWLQQMGAGALSNFGQLARPALSALRKAGQSESKAVQQSATKAIEAIEQGKPQPDLIEKHRQIEQKIAEIFGAKQNDAK